MLAGLPQLRSKLFLLCVKNFTMAEGGVLHVVSSRSFSPTKSPTRPQHYRRPVKAKGDVSSAWLCAYCQGLLILAFQTDCGCRFCEVCVDELAEKPTTRRQCPGGAANCGPFARNRGELRLRPKPDRAVDRSISKIVIVCPNQCGIQNLYAAHLFTHLRDACPNQFCPECKEVTERVNFERSHLGMVECKDCSAVIPQCLFESHREDPTSPNFCPRFSGPCPYCKTEEIKANEFKLHRLFCDKWQQECKFEVLGCKGDHKKNSNEELVVHLSYILERVTKSSPRLTASERKRMMEQSLENKRQCSETVKELEQIEKTIKDDSEFTLRLDRSAEHVARHRNHIEQYQQLLQRATALSLHSEQPTQFPVAPYIWRIPSYLDLKKHESVLDSRPFVSDHYGYKMRVRLYLNGDGQGRGTHVSAYIILMAHDYDNLQSWPFQLPFLFTLLDQTQKGQDYQQLIHPNPKSRSFQRPPKTEADSVRASGCAKFFPLERLLPHCIYLLDGTLYIKIDVLNRPGT